MQHPGWTLVILGPVIAGAIWLLAPHVPVEGVLDPLVQPRLFRNVDFATVMCVVTD